MADNTRNQGQGGQGDRGSQQGNKGGQQTQGGAQQGGRSDQNR